MRQTYKIIPIYTADVSGVCSALYELGGMTVMHDPSGCNSTYNTHDEIRWYDQDSLIFISGLSEIDAIMGNDEKFLNDIMDTARELHPKFIALAGSPIPYMNGTDFPALAEVLEHELDIPTFSVPTNGMHDYVYGAGIALEEIAKKFIKRKCSWEGVTEKKLPRTVNLLGVTPLDFGAYNRAGYMKGNLEKCGWKVLSTWAMGDSLENLSCALQAEVNLVVSSVGLRLAKYLEKEYKMPYVVGTPVGGFTEAITHALETKEKYPYKRMRRQHQEKADYEKTNKEYTTVTFVGEPVTTESLASAVEEKYPVTARVLCPLQETDGLLCETSRQVLGEEAMEEALGEAKIIVADPLYRPICPKESRLYELPHLAFSGRIYKKELEKAGEFWKYEKTL